MAQSLQFTSGFLYTGSGPAMVLPIDVSGTGYPGLVCSDFGFRYGGNFGTGGGTGKTLSVYTNDGFGDLTSNATLSVGLEPVGLAVADVNGDGALDIICANVGDGTLTVLTNNRQGGFVASSTIVVGDAAVYVAAADVNGDGYVDLISANYNDSTLTVLTNNGHGLFKLSSTLDVGPSPDCIAAVDINGDGSVDLVCANSGNGTLTAFTNNGHGTFIFNASILVTNGASWVIGTDVDGNGSIDLVVAAGNYLLSVLTNDGSGNFSLKTIAQGAGGMGTVAAADFNGDGKVDLVCPVNGNDMQGAMVVLTNDGTGNFKFATEDDVGSSDYINYPNFVTAADFNRDGNMDIAVSCFGSAILSVLTQTDVTPKPIVAITSPANDAVLSTEEGFEITSTATSSSNIEVVIYYLGTSIFASTNSPFSVQVPAGLITAGTHSLQAEAVDSAGHIGWSPEVQVNFKTPTIQKSGGKALTFNKATLSVGSGPIYILPVDLTGNGHLDLVTANFGFIAYPYYECLGEYEGTGSNLTFCMNNGAGVFSSNYSALVGPLIVPSAPTCVAAADFNNDGKLELVSTDTGIPQLWTLTNNAQGFFSQKSEINPGGTVPFYLTNADFNGDGLQDLVSVDHLSGNLAVLTNTGFGTFSNSATLPTPDAPIWVAVADVNGDGKPDLVSANYGDCGSGNTLTVFTNSGNGHFVSNATLTVGGTYSGPMCVVAADINGDGFADLISVNQNNSTLSVFINDGHGNFSLQTIIPVLYPSALVAADFNGDGAIDLAVAGTESNYVGEVTLFLNDGTGNFGSNTVIEIGTEDNQNYLSSLVAADLNGDGKMDLAVANYATATLTVLTQTSSQQKPPPPPPAPSVSLTSPTNGQFFSTAVSFPIKATAENASAVGFLLDGALLGTSTQAPYVFQVAAGLIAPGGHTVQAVAVNSAGVTAYSAAVQITVNTPGTALIDFDALNATSGAVVGTALANYLAPYGVTLTNVTFGTAMEAVNTNSFTGNILVEAPSSPNIFTQAGLNQPVSFTLRFATNLQAFGFTRAGFYPSSPMWTATAFDSAGTELSSVTEPLIVSADITPPKSFVLTGNGIASVRFESDNEQTAAFSAVLLDNLDLIYNPTTPALSVTLSVSNPATNDIIAPASITLDASVTDQLGASYDVTFFAGPTPLGTVSSSPGSPSQLILNNVLPGNYALQAQAVDLSTGISALSTIVPITVQLEANSTLVNFDSLNAKTVPVETAAVEKYLAGFGISVASLTQGTQLTVNSQQHIAGGNAVLAPSPPNLLTQTGTAGPMQFTLRFAPLLSQFGFTRPELLANPFVSHPAWQVTAFDGAGNVVEQAGEAEIDSSTNVGAREFSLGQPGGPGIATVQFASQGKLLTTFNAMLVDNLVLTTNPAGAQFPPAVAITSPVSGLILPRPPSLNITAAASAASGIASVSFYASTPAAGNILLGTDTTSPYSFNWLNPKKGAYGLTAVALSTSGLSETSPVVNIVLQAAAFVFSFTSPPANQTVPKGGSATFSAVVTGTTQPSYQWYFDSSPITGATSSMLVLPPPVRLFQAGTYSVIVSAPGQGSISSSATLTVIAPPVITSQPVGQTVPAGSDVFLDVGASGNGPLSYQWQLNGNNIPGATSSSYVIPSAQPRQSGNYQVTVTDQAASMQSTIAPVIVQTAITIPETNTTFATRASFNPLLGSISDSNDLATVQAGAPLPDGLPGGNSIWFTWTPTFTGTATLTTQGSDFESIMAVYTGTTLKNLKVVAADDGSGGFLTSLVTFNVTKNTAYQIAVDGYQGESGRVVLGFPAGTGYRILNTTTGDTVPVILKNPESLVVAPGGTASLSVEISSMTKAACQWSFQGSPIHGATGTSLVLSHVEPSSVGVYDVVVANAVGSVQSAPASVQISMNQGPHATSTGSKFVISTNENSPKALATLLRPYDSGGDSPGFSVAQVFSTVGATTELNEPQPCGQVGSGAAWFVYAAPANGIMQVNTAGSAFNTILGVYTGTGTSFASLTEEGCGYATNYLEEGQPSVVLTNVTKGTTFFILVEGYQGASGVAQLQIGLGKALSFAVMPTNLVVTAGLNTTFAATAIGSTPISYQWQLNGANVSGATKSTLTVTGAQSNMVGNYTIIASNSLGAVTSSPPATLTVQYAPAIIAGPSNQTVSLGLPAKFSIEALGVNVKTNPFVCQWFFNGAPIHKATGLTLLLPVTHWTNIGSYYIVITNDYGTVESEPATLELVDKTPPKVTITAPAANTVTNASMVTVTGTASDAVGVTNVQVEVGAAGFVNAIGTNNWSILVTLAPGENLISARSVNVSGIFSSVAKRTVKYETNGSSPNERVSQPNADDHSLLGASGAYSGLFYPATEPSRANSGFFTATIASGTSGAFSANILLDGGSYPLTGKFDASGEAKCVVQRAGKTPLTTSLRLAPDMSRGQMTGVISSANWRSTLQAGRAIIDSASNPAPAVERYALVIPSGATSPAGYLAIRNNAGGAALVTGTLADDARILRVAPITQGPAIPFYTPLYSGQGLFLAWITFTNAPTSANLGPAIWIGPGFTNLSDIIITK